MASPLIRAAQSAMRAATAVGATKAATLRRITSEYAPSTGLNSTVSTDYAWTGVIEEYTEFTARGGNTLTEGVVTGDKKWTGAAGDIAVNPTPETDKLIVEGVAYGIVNAKKDPAGALWILQVRR